MQSLSAEIKEKSAIVSKMEEDLHNLLLTVPNIPFHDVPIGGESENKTIRTWGSKKEYDFEIKDHIELVEAKGMIDFERGAKISGSGYPIYTKKGALLERALLNFMIDFHVQKHGYDEMIVPLAVNRSTMTGTGQLPKLENDMYHIDEDDMFLIPTGEVPVTNYYANNIIDEKFLPQKFVASTPCFRREAGSYGKDTKGLQRLHQFNKVEMVRFVKPETSYTVLEEMINDAEDILKALGLHFRTLVLASGDTSFASAKTIDLEVWAPGLNKYLEVSSISNFEDFQARRANIRYRDENRKVNFVHTLNGSGLATPRTFIAIVENYQNAEGDIIIPEVLQPYMHGLEKI